ncbi:MAG: hypothetical protein IJR92_04230 [Alphaproteobacteria bacterium]|nr:hypothetical protein [Alphaproteobacteria bacterium]
MKTQVINTPDKTFILTSNSVGIGMSVTVIDFKDGNPSSKLYESFSDMPAELRAELTLAQAAKRAVRVFDVNKYQH